jgi:hypothetical protein
MEVDNKSDILHNIKAAMCIAILSFISNKSNSNIQP